VKELVDLPTETPDRKSRTCKLRVTGERGVGARIADDPDAIHTGIKGDPGNISAFGGVPGVYHAATRTGDQ
jgi:hypothetical protein